MEIVSIILLSVLVILCIAILFVLRKSRSDISEPLLQVTQTLNNGINDARDMLNSRIDSANQAVNTTLSNALQNTTQNLISSIDSIKEQSRSTLDSKLTEFERAFSDNINELRSTIQSDLADGRNEMGATLQRLSETLSSLRTQLMQDVSKIREESKTSIESNFNIVQELIQTYLSDGRKELTDTLTNVSEDLQKRFDKLQTSNEAKLNEIRENVEKKLAENIDKNVAVFQDVTDRLSDLKVTNERIMEISQDINQLSTILQSPKLRGNIGEFALENMLQQVIPGEHYDMPFKVGSNLADAVIHLKQGELCIDSKFPLENFRKLIEPNLTEDEKNRYRKQLASDIKKHVDAIASKYIVPEVTLDFAFMFIPAESVYYEILMNQDLHQYALNKKIVPVSPNCLYAYLQVLAIGFRGMKIEQETKRIEQIILKMKKDFDQFKEHFRLIGTHLDHAISQYRNTDEDVKKFDFTISGLRMGELEYQEAAAIGTDNTQE